MAKVFLSPSNQYDNVYAYGNTTEGVQCGKIADACNQNDGGSKEVAVFIKIYALQHFQTGYGDKAVQRDADATHDAVWNGFQKAYKRSDKRNEDGEQSCCENSAHRCVLRNGHAAYGFTVGCVRAAAE